MSLYVVSHALLNYENDAKATTAMCLTSATILDADASLVLITKYICCLAYYILLSVVPNEKLVMRCTAGYAC